MKTALRLSGTSGIILVLVAIVLDVMPLPDDIYAAVIRSIEITVTIRLGIYLLGLSIAIWLGSCLWEVRRRISMVDALSDLPFRLP